jgi:hypothetical protein
MKQPQFHALYERWLKAHQVSITTIVALVTIGLSGYAAYTSTKANHSAEEANAIAKESQKENKQFSVITAANLWAENLVKFHDVDNELLEWEEANNLRREGPESIQIGDQKEQIIAYFKDFMELPPKKIIQTYQQRAESFITLKRMSEQYKPFEDQLNGVDLKLPIVPLLPRSRKATMTGGAVVGGKAGVTFHRAEEGGDHQKVDK